MKNKIMISVLSTILFSLIVITSLFIVISNYQYVENMKNNLKLNNEMLYKLINEDALKSQEQFFENGRNQSEIRITLIDKEGNVKYDSLKDYRGMENHNLRKEIIEAREKGEGSSIRYSDTTGKNMIYYATKLQDGSIIRTAMALENIKMLQNYYLKYYFAILIMVIIMAVILSSKLTHVIVEPIKDLQFITSRIAKGEYDRRVNIKSKDEIGELGRTFNNMADRLQLTLSDVIDKQNRLEAILKSMDSGVIAVDKNYKVIMINPYAKKIFGVDEDIIGQNLMDNIRDFEFENVFKNNKDEYTEIKILWPSERELRIKTADIINQNQHIGTVAVVQDITDIKRLENMRSQFVANVSHELKTPLTSIKGFAETLRYVEDSANKEKFLNIINDEAERLTRLINDILILSDIEQHRDDRMEEIDVTASLKNIYYLMKNTADKKNIKLELMVKDQCNICGNEDRFKQMIINLVDNAIKYSEREDEVSIICSKLKDKCVITVKDTGVGIPREHVSRLFERFYRVDKARSRANGGTGLGLAIVKHIILSFKGTIEVKSELGKGSEFIVRIPLYRG
ncbi:two-component system histidine kinase PnpS [Desnuesiella massiliensis]|uniref:two-component system histidine kinase PnpS n=1 Tax=Desnuesiella massiliensis TaxID=1650662 RepID=UPI0006E1310E|nr:ATP-binding protein [Desnuesiella massiliensis]